MSYVDADRTIMLIVFLTRPEALLLDQNDALSDARNRFDLPDDVIYLDGNSLGPLPSHVSAHLRNVVEHQWGNGLIRAWRTEGWADLPARVGSRIARLIGAQPGSVMTCDNTSINLYKVASAAVQMSDRPVILTDADNFPTDLYVLDSVARQHGKQIHMWNPTTDEVRQDVALVATTQVNYRTGERHDLASITSRAHAAGALTVFDLSHSAGAFPIDVAADGADFAVGCGYKYLNGGPGAPAFAYVAPQHQDAFRNPITGWWGHARPFDMSPEFEPADGIDRVRVGTQHVLSMAALDASLDLFDDYDLDDLRTKSLALTTLFMELLAARVPDADVVTPLDPDRRGSQVSFRHPDAYPISQALIERGVIGDFRNPDIARFGVGPLFVRYVDVWDAVHHLVEILDSGEWKDDRFQAVASIT